MPPVHLSGFSYRFQQLSRAHGQVTYVLLTRSPLSFHILVRLACIRKQDQTLHILAQNVFCVRLACIRHAASVHPEPTFFYSFFYFFLFSFPGSNSPFDFSSKRFLLTFSSFVLLSFSLFEIDVSCLRIFS